MACETLYQRMKALGPQVPELIILPVYSALPSEMQSRIFDRAPPGARKCVVATNIAEASLTIDGVYYVVDPGFCKQKVYNAKAGMESLVVTPISQASAKQRAGRAGRTGPGRCFRLYTESAYKNEMLPMDVPELLRSNLAAVVLQLKAMGVNDLLNFDFMDPPPPHAMVQALETLFKLGALDAEGLLTRMGRRMAEFPLDPRLSRVLLRSVELGCSEEVLTVVAMLSVENVFVRPKGREGQADVKKASFSDAAGDHLTLLKVYTQFEAAKRSPAWCSTMFLHARSLRRAADVRQQLVGIMDRLRLPIVTAGRDWSRIVRAIVSGFGFDSAARRTEQGEFQNLATGELLYLHPGSALFGKAPEMLLYHEAVMTTKLYMRNVVIVRPEILLEELPHVFKKVPSNQLSSRKRGVKIEPLYNRFEPPNAWRLSKRIG